MGTYRLNVPVLKDSELTSFASRARFETRDVKFGDEFTLIGAVLEETKSGGIDLRLAWRAEAATRRFGTTRSSTWLRIRKTCRLSAPTKGRMQPSRR